MDVVNATRTTAALATIVACLGSFNAAVGGRNKRYHQCEENREAPGRASATASIRGERWLLRHFIGTARQSSARRSVGGPSKHWLRLHKPGPSPDFEAVTVTETPLKRLEFGYGWNHLDLGDLPEAVLETTGIRLQNSTVDLHNFNARVQLVSEDEFGMPWMPAVTFGVTYKYNQSLKHIDSDLHGALDQSGLSYDQSVDLTLYVGKVFRQLPLPVAVNVGGRLTRGAHFGLLGFTDEYTPIFEGNVVVFLAPQLLLAAEFHQAPNDYEPIGSLVQPEDDLWTVAVAYLIKPHFTVAVGYGHLGRVLNHKANSSFGFTTKWEF